MPSLNRWTLDCLGHCFPRRVHDPPTPYIRFGTILDCSDFTRSRNSKLLSLINDVSEITCDVGADECNRTFFGRTASTEYPPIAAASSPHLGANNSAGRTLNPGAVLLDPAYTEFRVMEFRTNGCTGDGATTCDERTNQGEGKPTSSAYIYGDEERDEETTLHPA